MVAWSRSLIRPSLIRPTTTLIGIQQWLRSNSPSSTIYAQLLSSTINNKLYFLLHPACMCAQGEPVPIVQCRDDAMPFSCVLRVAIFLLLSTLPPRWRATSLTLMMTGIQPCTWQPILVSCPWWSTLWDPVDLTWRPLTRLAYIVYILLWPHLLHGHRGHGHLYLGCVSIFILCIVNKTLVVGLLSWVWDVVCTGTLVDVVHY